MRARHVRVLVALARARRQAGRGVTIGRNTRFGKHVTCSAAPGGEIVIGDGVEICPCCALSAGPNARLVIGDNVFIGGNCQIAANEHIAIGSDSMLAEYVTIRDHDHDVAYAPRLGRMLVGRVVIGARVWIAAKATITRSCQSIGDDAVIGAHALVNRPVPPACLAAGVPATIRRRDIRV